MDNFMDKLAKRFSAGEMIKANQAAEERELKRAKEQAVENEKLLQEIRRLNLKNAQLSDQVGQLIQCGIEQFEEYDKAADKNQTAYGEEVKKILSDMEAAMKQISEQISKIEEEKDVSEPIITKIDSMKADLQNAEEAKKSQFASMQAQIDKTVEASQGVPGKIIDARVALQGEIRNVKEAVAAVDAKLVRENNQDELVKKLKDGMDEELEALKRAIKALEEHVHKENVKVYRNVQAVVVDQTTLKARELGDRLDALERTTKKNKSLMPMVVITLLVAIASLVLQLLQIL